MNPKSRIKFNWWILNQSSNEFPIKQLKTLDQDSEYKQQCNCKNQKNTDEILLDSWGSTETTNRNWTKKVQRIPYERIDSLRLVQALIPCWKTLINLSFFNGGMLSAQRKRWEQEAKIEGMNFLY